MISEKMSLGIDLEIEILVWLPLKSLMSFRLVQRSWNDLIQTPTFLKSHSLIILYEEQPYITLLSCDNLMHIKSPFSSNSHQPITIESYGSFNGVFCLKGLCWYNNSCLDFFFWIDDSCLDELIIWNPTTREVHRIPPTSCLDTKSSMYGFGADDPNIIDFKVVKLHVKYYEKKHYISWAEVYSLGTKSWTPTLHAPPFTIITPKIPSKYNNLVNGIYHWITNNAFYYCNDDVANILCFNFRKNQFHQLRGNLLG